VRRVPEFLSERYEIDAMAADVEAAARRLAEAAAQLRDGGADVELVGSQFVPADEAAYTFFRASSAALVEAAHRNAGVPYERIVESIPLTAKPSRHVPTRPKEERP
jgi:hypothetical protein